MKRWIAFFVVLSVLSAFAHAEGKRKHVVWRCYSGGTDDGKLQVTKAKTVAIEAIPDFFPTDLWDQPWKGKTVTNEVIGKYRGQDIYCFTFRHELKPDEPQWQFDYALLACDVTDGEGPRKVRVFFIEAGDQVRHFAANATKTGANFTRIEAGQDIDGNGMMGNSWILDLMPSGPWLREATFSARKEPTITYRYNRAGRIISKKKVPSR